MALGYRHDKNGDQVYKFKDDGASTITSSTSFLTKPMSWTSSASGSELSSTTSTSSECPSCQSIPTPLECCWLSPYHGKQEDFPGCTDLVCHETFCGECSDHDECCDDCLIDCESQCGQDFNCDELDIGLDDAYCLDGSNCELFGDQTAQTFGYGRPLPQLATDNVTVESSGIRNVHDNTVPPSPRNDEDQSTLSSNLQPDPLSQISWAYHPQSNVQQTFEPPNLRDGFTCHGPIGYEFTPPNKIPLIRNATHLSHSSESFHITSDLTGSTLDAHHDHPDLLNQNNNTRMSFPPVRCQWADLNGEPCGKILRAGEEMHEHLKSAHDIKTQAYCRWIGCSASALGPSPHKFASSVERHTWGHSGYRPYRCSVCNEGFAAASVREEHYMNIHLRQKKFACDMCPHLCTSATNLKRHKYDKHSVERFQCEFCNQNGKRRLFPRGPNLARHFRNCKYVLAQFPEASTAGKAKTDWLPPGYKRGHHGMDKAKITPPKYLSATHNT